ncbi:Putative ribonuclease H domain-containing protein [Septoria linicola]|uniref:Ribonuclease H domain-containing protein n=1 Tax=Septoria linicola TaxID=215465 RepID=A0A9Q9B4D8_9PEZI|nr:Putative ribonuclease H domain-containing protein [Septoria linicola]
MGAKSSKITLEPLRGSQQHQLLANYQPRSKDDPFSVQSNPIPTSGGGGAVAARERPIFGQPSWSGIPAQQVATNSRTEKRDKVKKSLPTPGSVLIDLTLEDENEGPSAITCNVIDLTADDIEEPQSTRAQQQDLGRPLEYARQPAADSDLPNGFACEDRLNRDDRSGGTGRASSWEINYGDENTDSVGDTCGEHDYAAPVLSTAQRPLPGFLASEPDHGNVRHERAVKKIELAGVSGDLVPALSKRQRKVAKAIEKARRKTDRQAKAIVTQTNAQATTGAIGPLPAVQLSQPLVREDVGQTVAGITHALPHRPPPSELPLASIVGDLIPKITGGVGWLPGLYPLTGLAKQLEQETGRKPLRPLDLSVVAPLPSTRSIPPPAAYGGTLTMYTDGSWGHKDGSGGAGIAYQHNRVWYGRAVALGHVLDQHVCELEGIRHAVRMAHVIVPQVTASKLVIQTDSETCLFALSAKERGVEVLEMLKEINAEIQRDKAALDVEVEFWWVKGHVHTIGNERADMLAGYGMKSSRVSCHSGCEASAGSAAGHVFENPIPRELKRATQRHTILATQETKDLVLMGATSLPGRPEWQVSAERRVQEEKKRSEARLSARMHGTRVGASNEVRHAVKQLTRMERKRAGDGVCV